MAKRPNVPKKEKKNPNNCDFCGQQDRYQPLFKCHRCNGYFCSEHRLPENHNCPGLAEERKQSKEGGTGIFRRLYQDIEEDILPPIMENSYHETRKSDIRHEHQRRYSFSYWAYKFLYYKKGLIRSAIIATILTIMLVFGFGLVTNYRNTSFLLGTYGFVVDFLIVVFISVIINWRDKWADLIGAILIPMFLGSFLIPTINSSLIFFEVLIPLLGILYLSTLAGNVIKHENFNKIESSISYILKIIFVILFITMVASAVTNAKTLNSFGTVLSSLNLAVGSNNTISTSDNFTLGISGFAPFQVTSATCGPSGLTINLYNPNSYNVEFTAITVVSAKIYPYGNSTNYVAKSDDTADSIGLAAAGGYGSVSDGNYNYPGTGFFACSQNADYSLSLNLAYEYGNQYNAVVQGYASGTINLVSSG